MKTILILLTGYFALCMSAIWLLWIKVLKPTGLWYDECRALEKAIRSQDDKDGQLKELYRLNKFSWHRTTGERMRELALMMEMKYGLKILK